jgi:hypothetical protein
MRLILTEISDMTANAAAVALNPAKVKVPGGSKWQVAQVIGYRERLGLSTQPPASRRHHGRRSR